MPSPALICEFHGNRPLGAHTCLRSLSQTLKQMGRDGLITRTVLPTMPVSVEYAITPLGQTLAAVLDGLQLWARDHIADVLAARRRYDGSGRG